MIDNSLKQDLANQLYGIGVIKFGEFTFKSGIISPMYVDLRILISYPKVLKSVAETLAQLIKPLEYDRLAGIPYAAMPIAGAVSLLLEKPWIYARKEVKDYGLKKSIEGEYEKGDKIVVIDDLITKGDSKIETLKPFLDEGLVVKDFVVLLDYEKGGSEMLRQKGYALHSAMTVKELVEALSMSKVINSAMHDKVVDFLAKN